MKLGLIYDSKFPFSGEHPSDEALCKLTGIFDWIHSDNLHEKSAEQYAAIINLHGRYFPKQFWTALKNQLMHGAGLVNVGDGTPFSVPVMCKPEGITQERPQTAYHTELSIINALPISADRYTHLEANPDLALLAGFETCFGCKDTLGMLVQFSKVKDIPHETGSTGPMDAVMHPLLTGYMDNGRKTAAPAVLIENLKGCYAGGRWIFLNQQPDACFWSHGGADLLIRLAEYAATGSFDILIRTNYAAYYPGEQPTLLLQGQKLSGAAAEGSIHLTVHKDDVTVYETTIQLSLDRDIRYQSLPLPLQVESGMYLVTCRISIAGEPDRIIRNGFWGYDFALMHKGNFLTCGRDYFYKDGKPMPIVGMTYMQSDMHRKFIYLPNVYRWDRDFSEMREAGINLIRTGIWTGYRQVMFNDGIPSEEILRALDAMFMTAKKHDIPVIFNFFAFAPEMWEGINPYLDPRSLQAQKRFISCFVSRHLQSKGLSWDLINEPSVSNPLRLWRAAPNYDVYELKEWRSWLKEKHGTIEALQEHWNHTPAELPSFDAIPLPVEKDFNQAPENAEPIKGMNTMDYILFTQHVLAKWTREMTSTIRALGSTQLITIGQDEALMAERPSPLFYGQYVDYTCNHSWWLMDDLYYDGIFAKTPNKPSLIQETGIMYVQNADGRGRRSEAELRNILERKYALAFAANNAGAIQWLWNINVYMDSTNEVNIGAVRADGTQKLEADVSYDFGDFVRQTAYLFEGRKQEEVAVVYPFSSDYSIRDYAVQSVKKLSRVLGYRMHIPFKALNEYDLSGFGVEKLIILPSPRILLQSAWDTLLDRVAEGCTLLFTGAFQQDEFWGCVPFRGEQLHLTTRVENVRREETLYMDDTAYTATFGGNRIAWVDKETVDGQNVVQVIPYGKGKFLWCSLPIEVNEEMEIIEAVYSKALQQAGINPVFRWNEPKAEGILAKKLDFAEGMVYIFVSESGQDHHLDVTDMDTGCTYKFLLESDRSVLFAVDKKGNFIRSYRSVAIEIA